MNSLLQSVAQRGTGAKTNQLKRADLAGKTGTTNDSHDAWFAGYQHSLVAIAWIGYDNPRSLGDKETGGGLALAGVDGLHEPRAARRAGMRPLQPPDVTSLGGELYFDDMTPGHGFVATIGVSQAPPQEASGVSGVDGAGARCRRAGKAGHHESVQGTVTAPFRCGHEPRPVRLKS